MARMTHKDRILALLRESPGLDDDEITRVLGIPQRQQVNQICRLMESHGRLKRGQAASGKIQNYLLPVGDQLAKKPGECSPPRKTLSSPEIPIDPVIDMSSQQLRPKSVVTHTGQIAAELASTLIILPCSGSKARFTGHYPKGVSILNSLPEETALELSIARDAVRNRTDFDESTLMPAWERYQGMLYKSARPALANAIENKLHILILSGGYGVVTATEPIGYYNAVFKPSWWPKGLLEKIIATYVETKQLRHIRAFVSATTAYRRIIERVAWQRTGVEDTILYLPEQTTGAMIKAPRAQGEAVTAFLDGKLTSDWRSSDGLRIQDLRIA